MQIQVMPETDAGKHWYNPFDLTKVWPHGDYPVIDVGMFELNRNSDNYFAEIEQLAFAPSNIVPGISWSPDKMLQAHIFSYADAHRYRLGTHYEALPVNAPKCPVHNYHKDGPTRFFPNNPIPDAFYEPNSFGGPVERPDVKEPPLKIDGDADRYNHRDGNDDYRQVTALFNLFDSGQKARLYSNVAEAMGSVPKEITERQLAHFKKVHADYEAGVRFNFKKPPNWALVERWSESSRPLFPKSHLPVFSLLFLLLEKLSFATRRRRRLNVKSPRRWISSTAPAHDGLTEAHCD